MKHKPLVKVLTAGTFWGVFVFHEPITVLALIAILMVLGAIVVMNIKVKMK